jgi:exodeoxyribonuclease VII large subunit
MSPLSVLGRGYAIALGPDGKAVRRAADVRVGDALQLRVAQGSLLVNVRRVVGEQDGSTSLPTPESEAEA